MVKALGYSDICTISFNARFHEVYPNSEFLSIPPAESSLIDWKSSDSETNASQGCECFYGTHMRSFRLFHGGASVNQMKWSIE